MERLRAYYLDRSSGFDISSEMFDAVLGNRPPSPLDFDARLRAVERFLKSTPQPAWRPTSASPTSCARPRSRRRRSVKIELLREPAEQRLLGELERRRPGRAIARATPLRRRDEAAGAAARAGRCVFRLRDGDGRRRCNCAQPSRAARPAAQSVPAHGRSVAPAGLTCSSSAPALHDSVAFHAGVFGRRCVSGAVSTPRRYAVSRALGAHASCGSSSVFAVSTTWSKGVKTFRADNHISMWKHSSTWETIAQMLVFPPQSWVLKHELMWIPIVGWAIRAMRPIAIDRGSGRRR